MDDFDDSDLPAKLSVLPVRTQVRIVGSAETENDWLQGTVIKIEISEFEVRYEVAFWDGGYQQVWFPSFLIEVAEEESESTPTRRIGFR